ncbi:MAG: sulfotransferase family protein [Maricaulaceae bacterium]
MSLSPIPLPPAPDAVDRERLAEPSLWRQYVSIPSLNAVYVAVPKVACTVWKAWARRVEGLPAPDHPRLAHDRGAEGGLTYLDQMSPEGRAEALQGVVFSFVRHPETRLLSAWLNKYSKPLAKIDQEMYWVGQKLGGKLIYDEDGPHAIPFDRFVEAACDQSDVEMNQHWRPQSTILQWGAVRLDFMGRFEHMAADGAALRAYLGAEADLSPRVRKFFPSQGTQDQYDAFYTPDLLRMVRERWAKDFEAFGYDAPADRS